MMNAVSVFMAIITFCYSIATMIQIFTYTSNYNIPVLILINYTYAENNTFVEF